LVHVTNSICYHLVSHFKFRNSLIFKLYFKL
jgi:hypothetical protein